MPGVTLQVIAEAEDGVEQYMENMGLFGKDRPDKDAEAVILTKYIVSPDRSIEFIKAFKCVSFLLMILYYILSKPMLSDTTTADACQQADDE